MKIYSLLFILFVQLTFSGSSFAQNNQFKALLVTTTNGFHHESLHAGVLAIQQLGAKNYFDVELLAGSGGFNDKYLEQFKVIIFLNTTGDILDSAKQKAMERFIQSGKGFVGIHSASDTEYGWDWYTRLVGRMFHIHPAVQTAKINIVDPGFPGLQGFVQNQLFTDEWYEFGPEKVSDLRYILSIDETSYDHRAKWGEKVAMGMGKLHPIAWYHNFDGGRSFYTAMGHVPAVFSDPAFLNHLYAGIYWAATGKK